MSVCQSVRLSTWKQLGSHSKNFDQILHLSVIRKSVEKRQVKLQHDKNNEYFPWRPIYIFILSRWVFPRMRNVAD